MSNSERNCDVLVIGTGAAGLTAAITAAKAGLNVLIVEKEHEFGGTTALSGGMIWVPGNHHSRELTDKAGQEPDTIEAVRTYLNGEVGNYRDEARLEAYLKAGPDMVRFLEAETEVKFYGMDYPDYHANRPGGRTCRSLCTVNYQASKLGPEIRKLKNQLTQTLFLGLAIGSRGEMKEFMRAGRSIRSMGFVLKKLAGHFRDLARYGRSEQMVRGRALVGRLMRTVLDLGIPYLLSAPAHRLIVEGGKVAGAEIETGQGVMRVRARRGVVLACGGYPRDEARRLATYPYRAIGANHASPTPLGNTGDGVRMAEQAGGAFTTAVAQPGIWMPVSVIPDRKGLDGVWPHLVDRQKPGFIAVTKHGKRFTDESQNYHDFVPDLIAACAGEDEVYCWLIADSRTVKRWGMGVVRPWPVPRGRHLRSGYLKRASTLAELARITGIDAGGLAQTVEAFNRYALAGVDPDFGRGSRIYDLYQGDSEVGPNPCLAPIEHAPFYAVKVLAGDIGTYAGLKTDAHARVLDAAGAPVPGLYAVGNDQASVFGGGYPGAGSTLGPGMVFGYVAGRHVAEAA
jgi:succinate dehydrogenase/fumarate reductase flavoprotein subunit